MKKLANIMITVMLLVTALLIFDLYQVSNTNLPNNNDTSRVLFNTGWQYSFDDSDFNDCNSPLELVGKKADFVVLKNTVPEINNAFNSLQFHLSRSMVKIYLEDELVFNIDETNLAPIGKSPGNMPLFVTLPNMQVGDKITIELIPVYGTVEMSSFYLAEESAGVYDMISDELFNFVLSAIMTVFGLVEIAFYIFVGRKNKAIHMLHLGFFTLIAGLYTFTVLTMLSLVFGEPYIVSVASYLLLSLLPIPLLFFFCTAYELKFNKHLYALIILHSLYWFVVTVLQLNDIMDVRQSLKVCHLLLAASILSVIISAICEIVVYKNKKMRVFIVGGITLCAFSIADLITYYFAYEHYMSTYFKLGVTSFSAVLFLGYTSELAEMIKQNAHTKLFEKLAYQDILTRSKNRTCFELDLEPYRNGKKSMENVVIGIFDVNNLKLINDTKGHKYGDKLIISAHEAIIRTFDKYASIYRIGGDEFAIISTDIFDVQIPKLLTTLENNVEKINRTVDFNLSIASGLDIYDAKVDNDVDELFKRVDKKMYEHKMKTKKTEMQNDN